MGISGIAGSSMYSSVSTLKSFQQLNRDVDSQGVAQASRISKAAGDYSRVSNFGNETKIGTSKFQRGNETIATIGENKTSALMDKAKSYYAVSNFGTETKLGSSKFQQTVKAASEQGQRNVSESMEKAASYTKVSNFGTETKLGSSKFQQANAQVSAKFAAVASAYKQAASLGNVSRGATVDIGA